MRFWLSIRFKILAVAATLLVSALILQALIAARIFKRDKTDLVFDLNKNAVTTFSADIHTALAAATDKLKLLSALYIDRQILLKEKYSEVMESDEQMVYASIRADGFTALEISPSLFLELHHLPQDFFKTLEVQIPIPVNKINTAGYFVWNATLKNAPPLIGVGISVPVPGQNKNILTISFLTADKFLAKIREQKLNELLVTDSEGRALLHTNKNLLDEKANQTDLPIVAQALSSSFASGILQYAFGTKTKLAAYAKVSLGNLNVISQSNSDLVDVAIEDVLSQSRILSLIIFTVIFISTLLLSGSITKPLLGVANAMAEFRQGVVLLLPHRNDEIGVLSYQFNELAKDTQQNFQQLEEANRNLENKINEQTKALVSKQREMETLGPRDTLTGLIRRPALDEVLKNEIEKSKTQQQCLSIVQIDLDHFAQYNTSGGSFAGNTLLVSISTLMLGALRPSDTVARLGEEKFCIVLPNTNLQEACVIAENLRLLVEKSPFRFGELQPSGTVTASFGVATLEVGDNLTHNQILQFSEEALQRAKANGNNQVQYYETRKAA